MANRLGEMMSESPEILAYRSVATPMGDLGCTASPQGVRSAIFAGTHSAETDAGRSSAAARHLDLLERELLAYFDGVLRRFTVALDPVGTEFQQRVWMLLREIQFGETRSYSWLAVRLDSPGASRAVGAANGANPIAIIIPCHRVIASDGTMCGYAGGTDRKRWLLDHERGTSGTLFENAAEAALF